ncbi:FUSC family protein [Mycoplana ramosa]|uniref:FUSC family protein n=1 Tax=Mycoplana ramosa TaxID=40837 RepID=A0ABW3YYL8_MYCRA
MSAIAANWGFVPERFSFALRTATGACLALLIAWLIGLEHPQWSAMTVFAAAQPVRNMLVEKSLFRAIGTVVGTLVGMVLILAAGGNPALLVVGLAAWISVCAGFGNVLRGFVGYGTILAGYSAAMVALLETAHPGHLLSLGVDRALTVLTGVVVGLVIGLILTPAASETDIAGRARRLAARMLAEMATFARGGPPISEREQQELLAEMAAIDDRLDPHSAGSLASRRSARNLRAVVAAQVSSLLWLKTERFVPVAPGVADALSRSARALEDPGSAAQTIASLHEAIRLAQQNPPLRDVLQRQAAALRDRIGREDRSEARVDARLEDRSQMRHPVVLHRDWIGARHAALRAGFVMLLVGLLWVVTGWQAGPYVLLGTSVMISLFSTFENPAFMMRHVLAGQFFGAIAALVCRWVVWPLGTSALDLVFLLMPFILSGVLPLSHRRTMLGGTDYVLILLLLSQPAYPLSGSFDASLSTAAAVVAAPAIALLAYGLIFPTDALRRLDTLIAMMVRELQQIAAAPDAAEHRLVWRARLYHRLLRLVRLAQASGESRISPADGGLAVYALGAATLSMHERMQDPALPVGSRRALRLALGRMEHITARPRAVPAALLRAADRLDAEGVGAGELLRSAGRAMTQNLAFFERAGNLASRRTSRA